MILSFASYYLTAPVEDRRIITILSAAFQDNNRMKALIGASRQNFAKAVNALLTYCYFMVKKLGGIFTSKDKTAFLLYYRKSEHYWAFRDFLRYLHIAFFVVGVSRLGYVLRREQLIKKARQQKIQQENDEDFLYVWFLAQTKDYKGIDGLLEAKSFIQQLSKDLNLPIYMETTEARLVPIYKRAGFKFYDYREDQAVGLKVWFGRFGEEKS